VRVITIHKELQEALREYVATLYRARPGTRIFAGRTKSFFEHEMERGIKLSGVKKITVHCTRHSHASMLVQMGFSPIEIAKRLGHAETKNVKSVAVPVNNLFGGEEYVKVKKSDWNKIMDAFSRAVSRNHLLEKYEKKIFELEGKISILSGQVEKLKCFVASRGLGEEFVEFVKSLAPKTVKQRLEEKKAVAEVQNQRRKSEQQILPDKKKRLQQEM
jgi:hypothetical protein